MSRRTRPSALEKTFHNVMNSRLSETDKNCIAEVFRTFTKYKQESQSLREQLAEKTAYIESAKNEIENIIEMGKKVFDDQIVNLDELVNSIFTVENTVTSFAEELKSRKVNHHEFGEMVFVKDIDKVVKMFTERSDTAEADKEGAVGIGN